MEPTVLIFLSNNCQNLGTVIAYGVWCHIFRIKNFPKHPLNFEVLICYFLAVITDLSCNREKNYWRKKHNLAYKTKKM